MTAENRTGARVRAYTDFVIRRAPLIILLTLLGMAATSAWLVVARPLRLDSDLSSLLPRDMPSVVALRDVAGRLGSTDALAVAVESPSPAANAAFIDRLAAELSTWPELQAVVTREDKSVFRDRRLLYLDLADLQQIVARAKERLDHEKRIRNPLYVSLDDEEPPDLSFPELAAKYQARLGVHATGSGSTLQDRLASPDGRIMLLLARPAGAATDMDSVLGLTEKTERAIARLRSAQDRAQDPSMRAEVVGGYRVRHREYHSIVGAIVPSLGTSFLLVLGILFFYFRRARALLLIFVPLCAAMVFTAGLAALLLGRLTVTTALIFAVLLGLGEDYGVHLTTCYLDARAQELPLAEALARCIGRTGRSILVSGAITICALSALFLARFKGFTEFGIIATLGLSVCIAVTLLMLPALAAVMERWSAPKPWRHATPPRREPAERRRVPTWLLRGLLAAIVCSAVAGAWSVRALRFEYDFRKLRGRGAAATIDISQALGRDSTMAIAILPSAEAAQRLTRDLEARIAADSARSGTLSQVLSLDTFIPRDQPAKLALLAALSEYVKEALAYSDLSAEHRRQLEEVARWAAAPALSAAELPAWLREKFTEKDGTLGRVVYVYAHVNEWDAIEVEKFYREYGVLDVAAGNGKVHLAASGFILVDVIRAVQRDGWLILSASILIMLALLFIDLRSVGHVLLVSLPLAIGLAWMGGLMVLCDVRLGLYNMLILPVILGTAIDASVHLFHAWQHEEAGSIPWILRTTGLAAAAAAITDGAGFVGMILIGHDGLRSIGLLGTLGLAACLAGALVTLPLLLSLAERSRPRRSSR